MKKKVIKHAVGGKTTLLTSVLFVLTSVFSPRGTTLTAFCRCWYGCSRMLDGLVSSHPKKLAPGGRKRLYDMGHLKTFLIVTSDLCRAIHRRVGDGLSGRIERWRRWRRRQRFFDISTDDFYLRLSTARRSRWRRMFNPLKAVAQD